jgi:hypothetical protein
VVRLLPQVRVGVSQGVKPEVGVHAQATVGKAARAGWHDSAETRRDKCVGSERLRSRDV